MAQCVGGRDSDVAMERKEPVRINGFERPFHPLQVISWVVFGLDVLTFSVFAIPLIGHHVAKLVVAACYAVSVGVLVLAAVKATGRDPADPHVRLQDMELRNEDVEELPFCTTCSTHVFAQSKHCRACNKCVNSFDHHCMWLNTCIGERNYRPFAVCICSVAVMTGIVLCTCVYLAIEFFIDGDALDKRLDDGPLFKGLPSEAVLSILVALSFVNLPLFALDMQLVVLHAFLASQNLTTYEYIMTKDSLEEEQLAELSEEKHPKKLAESKGAAAEQGARNEKDGKNRFLRRGMKTLPRWMDWIVFVRCWRRKRRPQKDKIEQIEIEASADKGERPESTSEVTSVALPLGPKEHGHDRTVVETPTPPGSTVDPAGEPLTLDSIPDTSAATDAAGAAGATGGSGAAASSSRPRIIGSPREEEAVSRPLPVRSRSGSAGQEREVEHGGEAVEVLPASQGQSSDSAGVAGCLGCGSLSDRSNRGVDIAQAQSIPSAAASV